MRVVPEVDMPGHSDYFEKATGLKLQTPEGMAVMQKALDEVIPLFKDSFFHIGSDEVRFEMDSFMPEMIKYFRSKGKKSLPGIRVIHLIRMPSECAGEKMKPTSYR